MASKEIHVVATFKPKADKIDDVAKILAESAANIHKKEPNTLRFYLLRPKKGNELIAVEKYADAGALKVHGGTEYFKAMIGKVTPLLAAPTDLKICNFVTGFEGRPSKL
ncbi:predicted protein [Uncinocarpus reesii 1704]|uniref:ABM domain-containing protein n=1 Tax=Uncinocarpus reesii (strain UAMH 1704) TaxID=336963 RepID=C4JE42_UNCRE|nr:uncharacterized protein UREG_00466 [Uncinocarpus reesii 1704]EEP75620.1 predicted protein [Uncinocarpus reesii 1704]